VSALLLVEVIDTASTLLDAILAWIVAAAFVATVVYTAVLTGAWAWRAIRRGVGGPLWARGRLNARILARNRVRGSGGLLRLPSGAGRVVGAPLIGSGAEVLRQDPPRLVGAADTSHHLPEFDGHDGGLRLVAPGQEDAAAEQADRGDHVGDVGARL
jgi:hypothetical protein